MESALERAVEWGRVRVPVREKERAVEWVLELVLEWVWVEFQS